MVLQNEKRKSATNRRTNLYTVLSCKTDSGCDDSSHPLAVLFRLWLLENRHPVVATISVIHVYNGASCIARVHHVGVVTGTALPSGNSRCGIDRPHGDIFTSGTHTVVRKINGNFFATRRCNIT